MPDLRAAVVAVLLAGPFAAGAATGAGSDEHAPVDFRFTDQDIVESSGLTVVDGLVATTNDSGDSGRVFAVDPAAGETVGVTRWSADPADVEALAPAGRGHLWVADIGDNREVRDAVEVARVPVERGERDVRPVPYELRYPDGARDAEALLTHPLTGRLLVVTKGVFAGEVMEAPARLRTDRPNRLRSVARTAGIVTDGAFLPGGGVVVLRTYTRAIAYSHPSWQHLADWELPEQDQGEGLAVDGHDLLLSSEGARSPVLRVPLPPQVLAADLSGSPLWSAWGWLRVLQGGPAG